MQQRRQAELPESGSLHAQPRAWPIVRIETFTMWVNV
jgi:hypothetical protein